MSQFNEETQDPILSEDVAPILIEINREWYNEITSEVCIFLNEEDDQDPKVREFILNAVKEKILSIQLYEEETKDLPF